MASLYLGIVHNRRFSIAAGTRGVGFYPARPGAGRPPPEPCLFSEPPAARPACSSLALIMVGRTGLCIRVTRRRRTSGGQHRPRRVVTSRSSGRRRPGTRPTAIS